MTDDMDSVDIKKFANLKQKGKHGGGTEPLQTDTVGFEDHYNPIQTQEQFHRQLVEIDDEMGKSDIEMLKYLCRDHVAVSKLEKVERGTDLFEFMEKAQMIDRTNVDFLLECLLRIHRLDLVRKLGYTPDTVKARLPAITKVMPFRVLLLNLSEDVGSDELSKMKFLLKGQIRKKKLQDLDSTLELFVFLEQEGELSAENTQLLVDLFKNINRADLKEEVEIYRGSSQKKTLGPSQLPQNRLQPSPAAVPQPQQGHVIQVGGRTTQVLPNVPQSEMALAGNRVAPTDRENVRVQRAEVSRSVSAGTIELSSSENGADSIIPDPLLLQISMDIKEQWMELGFDLGFTNEQLGQLEINFPDKQTRVFRMLKTWRDGKTDKGQILPGLRFILTKLGHKNLLNTINQYAAKFVGSQPGITRSHSSQPTQRPAVDQRRDRNYTVSSGEAQPSLAPNLTERLQVQRPVGGGDTVLSTQGNDQAVNVPQNQGGTVTLPPNVRGPPVGPVTGQRLPWQPGQPLPQQQYSDQVGQMQPVVAPQQPLPGQQGPDQPVQVQRFQARGEQLRQQLQQLNISEAGRLPEPSRLPEYSMSRRPRGWCVIINNTEFIIDRADPSCKEMPARQGSDVDASNLHQIFTELGFITRYEQNLSDVELSRCLVDVSYNVDHSEFDCFVCCILSHGVLGHIYGSNGRLVNIKDLTNCFQSNKCPSLAGKPKLFFLQACQGRDKQEGHEIEKDMATSADVETDGRKEMIPNEADFLLGYATVPGYVSYRSRSHGSWYIRKLCEMLTKYADSEDILSILVKVNEEVSKANASVDGGIFKQTPAPLVTLRKKLFFR